MRGPVGRIVVALLLFAAPASAVAAEPPGLGQTPFQLTADVNAQFPDVAVDDMGVGHFAWDVDASYPAADPLVYCRIPRGAKACQTTQTFGSLPQEAFGRPQVLTPGPGQVILITYRCCGPGDGVYAVVSTDGGNTFAAPRRIGSVEQSQAVYGPGTGAVSLTDDVVTGGIHYQAAPLDGYTTENANVGNGGGFRSYDGTIGFPNATTPLVAYDDLKTAYFRMWGGTGNVNDIASWLPEQTIGAASELRIATGFKGVVLMGKDHSDAPYQDVYTSRRFDTTTGTFAAPVPISNPKIETDVIFRDIFEDAGGNVAAIFVANGNHGKHSDPIRYRASTDGGKTWLPERTLVANTNDAGFDLQMGAGSDGGGFAVYDRNSTGPLSAVAIPPLGAASGGGGGGTAGQCVPSVTIGSAQAIALSGCLQHQSNGHYTTSDPVRLNGVDITPTTSRRRGAHAAAVGSVDLDVAGHQVHINGADILAGNIRLDHGSFDWHLGSGSGAITTFSHLEQFHVSIFGFPVAGTASLNFDGTGATIPIHVELPAIFGGVNGDITLRLANPGGLKLDGFRIHASDVFLGALEVKPIDVEYKGSQPPVFEGSATFLLPPTFSEPGVHVGFGFVNGKFKHAEGSYPLQLGIFPPYLYLQKIGLALSVDPLKIAGGVEMTGGPQIAGVSALDIDALPEHGGGFSFELGDPSILRLGGSLSVVSVPFAHGFVEYRTNGLLKFGGGLDFTAPLDVASITAGVPEGPPLGPGFVDLNNGRFNAPFEGNVCVPAGCSFIDVGAQGVVSSNGVAACGEFFISHTPEVGVSAGFGYHWGGDADVFGSLGGCDVSPYAESAGARQAGGATIAVKAGLPQENIIVQGAGKAPAITVTAPDGETVSSGPGGAPAKSAHMVLFPNAKSQTTTVLIATPVAGNYTVASQPGSAAITKVGHAEGLPEPKVTGSVSGKAYKRVLHYTVLQIPGQTVRFVERAAGAGADLGAAKGAKGSLPFHPTVGPKGTRQVVAVVEQDGVPRREIVVATYVAPPAQKPGRPRFVRVKRSGSSGARISWGTSARAVAYAIRVKLHDGTSHLFVVRSAKQRSLRVKGVPGTTFGTISVAGLTRQNLEGPARKAGVKKKPKKKKKPKH